MMIVDFNIKNKTILVIGGGQQAFEKGKRLEDAGAQVSYLALEFSEIFLGKNCVRKPYHKEDLKAVFFVYACTNNRELNHQIVLDAQEQNSLSASIHSDDSASIHAVREHKFNDLTVAVSTSGIYPAFGRVVLDDIKKNYWNYYKNQLPVLFRLRKRILEHVSDNDGRKKILRNLPFAPCGELLFYELAMQYGYAFVCIFHGNKSLETYGRIKRFIDAASWEEAPVYYVYLNDATIEWNNENYPHQRVLRPEEMEENLKQLTIQTIYFQPMLLEEGFYFEQLRNRVSYGTILNRLVQEEQMDLLLNPYSSYEQVLIAIHSSKNQQFRKMVEKNGKGNIHALEIGEALPVLKKEKTVVLVSFFILPGNHLLEDVFSMQGIAGTLIHEGYRVDEKRECLLEQKEFVEIVRQRLNEYRKG